MDPILKIELQDATVTTWCLLWSSGLQLEHELVNTGIIIGHGILAFGLSKALQGLWNKFTKPKPTDTK